jgi:superfamily II DNA or RNA helicase
MSSLLEKPKLELRPRQVVAMHQLFDAFKRGVRRVLLTCPTSFGKRICAVWLCDFAQQHGRKVLFVTNRRLLVSQMYQEAEHFGVNYGVIMASREGDSKASNQIASIQTLESWYFYDQFGIPSGQGLPEANLVIVDECITGDAEIQTTKGAKRLDDVVVGDVVMCHTGDGVGFSPVTHVWNRGPKSLLRITTSSGRIIKCTGSHPIMTQVGWTPAEQLEIGTMLVCAAADSYCQPDGATFTDTTLEQTSYSGTLRHRTGQSYLQNKNAARLSGHCWETAVSDTRMRPVLRRDSRVIMAGRKKNGAGTRQYFWHGLELLSAPAEMVDGDKLSSGLQQNSFLHSFRFTSFSDPAAEEKELLNQHSICLVESGWLGGFATTEVHRDRRCVCTQRDSTNSQYMLPPSGSIETTARLLSVAEEHADSLSISINHAGLLWQTQLNRLFHPAWTTRYESIVAIERIPAENVLDLEVREHSNFFANGILVHNCHQDFGRYQQLFSHYPDAKIVGLTATPVGAGGKSLVPDLYDEVLEPVRNSELIADGLVLKTIVYAPSEPSIQGVKITNKQEFNQEQLGKRVQECTVFANVFSEWAPFADRKTVVFAPGVAYGNDLCRQFRNRLGADQAYMITGATSQEERERIFELIRTDRAKVLVSVDVLREGWDMPEISCGIDLQPNNQLRTYWQKLGRVKRTHPGQQDAVWLDFAGNYWRFPHPDEDPVWPVGENETTQSVIERRREEGSEPQPIVCPKCFIGYQLTMKPPTCPACGHVIKGEPVKRVRMGNGKLKNVPAVAKKKKEKSEAERKRDKWKSQLFAGLAAGWTFGQCAIRYKHKHGEWPATGLPGTFPKKDARWKFAVGDEFKNAAALMMAFNKGG